jgi:tetratricopeptide (TPR) repeat protein
MGKYYVPFVARTPADRVREALNGAEDRVVGFRGKGARALELLHFMDQAAAGLADLQEAGVDVRAELTRFETIQRQLQRRKRQFLATVGPALAEERAQAKPGSDRWWWHIDELVAQERKDQILRALRWVGVAVVVGAIAWVIYDRTLRPPANVREAYQRSGSGQLLAEPGEEQDFQAALVEFEAAAAADPAEPEYWVWIGVIRNQLGEEDAAQDAFDEAESLYDTTRPGFLVQRAQAYLRVGDLERAAADANRAIAGYPEEGWTYAVRANVSVAQGDLVGAIEDLETAADLAAASDDTQLEAFARTQRGMVIQLQASQFQVAEPTPESE